MWFQPEPLLTVSSVVAPSVHPLRATSQAEQRRSRLPRVSSEHDRDAEALPIGVLLAADGTIRGNAVDALTPPGDVRYRSVWEQEPAASLPRRRDVRALAPRSDHDAAAQAPRSPRTGSLLCPQFPASLPPGVVRLDEGLADERPADERPADDWLAQARPLGAATATRPHVGEGDTGPVATRRGRAGMRDDAHSTRLPSRLDHLTQRGPMTGSLDLDADLFTSAAERFARQTPSGGIAARHTPSAGLALGHVRTLPVTATTAPTPDGGPRVPGAYPRRRDLRRQGGTAPTPVIGSASLATTGSLATPESPNRLFVPAPSQPAPCSGGIPIDAGLPRRRDLRLGVDPSTALDHRVEPVESAGSGDRTGAIAVGVARAAVMTMLVGVGYAVVSGHQLSLDVIPNATGTTDAAGAMMAAGPVADDRARAESEWDVRGEVSRAKNAAEKQTEARVAAAGAAAARVRAAKAAAAARAARLSEATRAANRDPKAVARLLAAQRGWGNTQFTCLDRLWTRESNWNYRATNPSSGAYGIPQALPGGKMASRGSDWRTNAATQIKWGLGYIADRYGTPCGAWAHSQSTGWY